MHESAIIFGVGQRGAIEDIIDADAGLSRTEAIPAVYTIGNADRPGVDVPEGIKVFSLSLIAFRKGSRLGQLSAEVGAGALYFWRKILADDQARGAGIV